MTNLETFSPSNPGPFYLKSGELSEYALACGYVENIWPAPDCRVEMYRDGGVYHVKVHVWVRDLPPEQTSWDVYDTITDARKGYHRLIRELTAIP